MLFDSSLCTVAQVEGKHRGDLKLHQHEKINKTNAHLGREELSLNVSGEDTS